jgi:hypothetical protein
MACCIASAKSSVHLLDFAVAPVADARQVFVAVLGRHGESSLAQLQLVGLGENY